MISKISRGWRVGGLIRYLMGPGRFNEHRDQRIIATWDGRPDAHQPPRAGDEFDCRDLAAEMVDAQVAAGIPLREPAPDARGKVPKGPVWHCSLRNHADDRVLSDAEWAEIAAEVMDRTKIAPRDDPWACRWVVIRHAADHVHIAAVLVRQDTGRRVHPRFDWPTVRAVCREVETRLGLTPTGDADRTAPRHPSRPEREKSDRTADPTLSVTSSRELLCDAARRAALLARTPEEFLGRLAERGLRTRAHHDGDGVVDGYALAAPDDVDAAGVPVWYAGGSLARDLSLPRLRALWASADPPPEPLPAEPSERASTGRAERAGATEQATEAVEAATDVVRHADDSADRSELVAGVVHSLRDLLIALEAVTPGRDHELAAAARSYDRAARVPHQVLPQHWSRKARELRTAAWRLAAVGTLSGRGRERGSLAALVAAIASLAAEVASYRAAQHRLVQARAARLCADALTADRSRGRPPRATGSDRRSRQTPDPRPAMGPEAVPRPPAAGTERRSAFRRRG